MKVKIFPGLFWQCVLLLNPIMLIGYGILLYGFIIYRDEDMAMFAAIFFTSVFLFYFYHMFIRRKDYYSSVVITESGITSTFIRKTWFRANWNELTYVGEFETSGAWRGSYQDWLVISKIPIKLGKAYFKGGTPNNAAMEGDGIFIAVNAKSRAEILKYISEDRIEKCGYYIRGKKYSD